MNKTKKNTRGITLIALVITIIVLLILAGVTISALSGDNGILTRAKEAKEKTEQAQQKEEETLLNMENVLGVYNFKNVNKSDTNPGGTVPENSSVLENDANNGIVIKDQNNNEWVWVEVPKTTVFSGLTIDTSKELTEQNYNDIRDKLIAYVTPYRSSYSDEWYDGCGLTSEKYKTVYQNMLKKVYTYGGFWIGRYEAGIDGSIDDLAKARTSLSARITTGVEPKSINQKDAIPYNYVYCSEAQALAEEMAPNSKYMTSLMFGIQWDLVCKFLEVKGGLTEEDINLNSNGWGNYSDVTRTITSNKAKQKGELWKIITGTKPASNVLLSTGATDETKKMNIYDLAGNEREWTLEKAPSSTEPCVYRGGGSSNKGSGYPVIGQSNYNIVYDSDGIGFRVTMYAE